MLDLNKMKERLFSERDGLSTLETEALIDENAALRAALIEQACLTAYYNGQGEVNMMTMDKTTGHLMFLRYFCISAKKVMAPLPEGVS